MQGPIPDKVVIIWPESKQDVQ